MEERFMHPQNSDEIISELTKPNSEEMDKFVKTFPKEIVRFAESLSSAFKKFLELKYLTEKELKNGNSISQRDFVTFFTYQIIDNLFTSSKTLLMGLQTASGNLMRQVAEGVAVVILCSMNQTIKRKYIKKGNEKTQSFYYYKSFKEDKSYARSHKAIGLLQENKDIIKISDYGIDILKLLKEHNNKYSHPTFWSTSSFISIGKPGMMYFGGCFDEGKIDWYKKELEARIGFCDKLPALINGLILRVKNLPL